MGRGLKEPAPPGDLRYPTGVWHYARGRAFAARGDFEAASGELGDVRQLAARKEAQEPVVGAFNSFADVLNVAADVLDGEIAAAQHKYGRAIAALRRAVAGEDALHYQEPPDWQYPARHSLGAVLLAAGRPREAEAVYREDLKRNPENGWALFGLMQSLEAQGKKHEAAAARPEIRGRLDSARTSWPRRRGSEPSAGGDRDPTARRDRSPRRRQWRRGPGGNTAPAVLSAG